MNFLKVREKITYFVHFQICLQGTFTLKSGQMTTCLCTTTALEECRGMLLLVLRDTREGKIKTKLSFTVPPFSISPDAPAYLT